MGGLHAVVTDADVIGSPDVAKSFLSVHAQASLSVFADVHLKKGAAVLACYPRPKIYLRLALTGYDCKEGRGPKRKSHTDITKKTPQFQQGWVRNEPSGNVHIIDFKSDTA